MPSGNMVRGAHPSSSRARRRLVDSNPTLSAFARAAVHLEHRTRGAGVRARRLRERTDVLMAKIKGVLLPNLPVLAFDARSWSARRFGRSDAVPPITVLLSTFVCAVTYTRCRGVRLE
jgi:hypothetical protein